MNDGLTPAALRSPFHATTISLTGMLLCVFTTLAVLVIVSRDQSGASLAEVTSSFSGSLREHGRNDVAVIVAAFRQAKEMPEMKHADSSSGGAHGLRFIESNGRSYDVSGEDEAGLFSGEKLLPTDVNGPVFAHLMTELQRYCRISPAEELGGQLALDLHSQISQSENSIRSSIERILKICRNSTTTIHHASAEFEIVVWASTPATDTLLAACEHAFDLEQSLEKSLKGQSAPAIKITSSGRIWTRTQSPRPLATVVVTTVNLQSRASEPETTVEKN